MSHLSYELTSKRIDGSGWNTTIDMRTWTASTPKFTYTIVNYSDGDFRWTERYYAYITTKCCNALLELDKEFTNLSYAMLYQQRHFRCRYEEPPRCKCKPSVLSPGN